LNGDHAAARAALAAMRDDYLAKLPALGAQLVEAARRGRDDAAARKEATVTAHRIRGTAGSLGLTAVGEAAGKLEDALEEGRWEAVDGALAELLAASG
jgi:HPt (histidine-containing phosphotransfer) domain-containing protein